MRLFCCSSNNFISGNVIQGNYIGVNANGDEALGNQREGIDISTSSSDASVTGTIVGGTTPGAGNLISGNNFDGILIGSFTTSNTTVQGNRIGTDATGMIAIPNDGDGVRIEHAKNNLIGGSAPGAGNLISGNGGNQSGLGRGDGISMSSSMNTIQGNLIGTDVTGTGPLRNLLSGITASGTNNTIGGIGVGEGNVIAFNGANGIRSNGPLIISNSFRGNSIHSNGTFSSPSASTLGIDIGPFGITPNDVGDSDTGSNNLQNFPIITSVAAGASSTNVKGSLNSSANTSLNLDFYRNTACDPSGNGEGERLIGSTTVSTDALGNVNFDVTFPVAISQNQLLTTTATDLAGNTSEFSPCSTVGLIGLSISDVSSAEGNSGAKSFSFPVTLASPATQQVTVNFETQDFTALAPASDYVSTSGAINIAVGQTSALIVVQVTGDFIVEEDETFFVRLISATNASILDGQGKGTILNDDVPPRLIFDESGPAANQATALDSVLFLRDPFRVSNPTNFLNTSADQNTRVIVFAENLTLDLFEPPSTVVVNLVASDSQSFMIRQTTFQQCLYRDSI